MARVAGLLLQLGLTPPLHAPPRLLYDGLGAAVLQHGTQHATLSLIYLEAPRAGPGVAASALAASLADSGCWREEWSADPPLGAPSSRVTLPAMPDPLVEAAGGALQLLGRRVTFDEPCRTWEAPRESWEARARAAGCIGKGEAAQPVDMMALAAACGLPSGYAFRPLVEADAAVVNAHWKYASGAATEAVLRACIASAPSVGAIHAASGELVGWMLCRYDGSLGVLQTLPPHAGRGIARAVARALSVLLWAWLPALVRGRRWGEGGAAAAAQGDTVAEEGLRAALARYVRPYVHIATSNAASERLFRGLGYTCVGAATWRVSSACAPRIAMRPLRLLQGGGCAGAPGGGDALPPAAGPPAEPAPAPLPAAELAAEPWLAGESPHALAAAPAELRALLSLVNRSYKQDDAFFVEQWRASLEDLRRFAREGVIFCGHALHLRRGGAGGGGGGAGDGPRGPEAEAPHGEASASAAEVRSYALGTAATSMAAGGWPSASLPDPPGAPDASPCAPHHPAARAFEEGALVTAVHISVDAARCAHLSLLTIEPALKRSGAATAVLKWALQAAARVYGATHAEAHVVSVKVRGWDGGVGAPARARCAAITPLPSPPPPPRSHGS